MGGWVGGWVGGRGRGGGATAVRRRGAAPFAAASASEMSSQWHAAKKKMPKSTEIKLPLFYLFFFHSFSYRCAFFSGLSGRLVSFLLLSRFCWDTLLGRLGRWFRWEPKRNTKKKGLEAKPTTHRRLINAKGREKMRLTPTLVNGSTANNSFFSRLNPVQHCDSKKKKPVKPSSTL